MEQVVFAIVTDEHQRSIEAVQESVYLHIHLGAPWCWW